MTIFIKTQLGNRLFEFLTNQSITFHVLYASGKNVIQGDLQNIECIDFIITMHVAKPITLSCLRNSLPSEQQM